MCWQSSFEDFIDEEHGEPSSHEKILNIDVKKSVDALDDLYDPGEE